jgi:adenylyltransferase/sulfurtransferase
VETCGGNGYQIILDGRADIDLGEFEKRLAALGNVKRGPFMLGFSDGTVDFSLFPDGRAIVRNVGDGNEARSVYSQYVGL